MRAPDWDMTLLGEHRARLMTSSGQDTFGRMVEIAEELRDYDCKPNRQGKVRDFRYFDPATHDFPYSFIVNRHDLLFYVRRSGFKRVPGGLAALRARFDSVKENPSGEWTLRIATVEDADALGAFLFDVPDRFALRRRAEDAAENGIQQRTDIG